MSLRRGCYPLNAGDLASLKIRSETEMICFDFRTLVTVLIPILICPVVVVVWMYCRERH